MSRRTARSALPALFAASLLLAACGTPPPPTPITPAPGAAPATLTPEVTPVPTVSPAPVVPPPVAGAPSAPPAAGPTGPTGPDRQPSGAPSPTPGRTGPPARDCAGKPGAQTVLALLRGPGGILGPDAAVTVTAGPLCADGWQFTVLSAPGNGSLQVITRGRPDALRLVTAGTDLCTAQISAEAPPGIAALACNGATPEEPDA